MGVKSNRNEIATRKGYGDVLSVTSILAYLADIRVLRTLVDWLFSGRNCSCLGMGGLLEDLV